MKAILLRRPGGPDALEYIGVPTPVPGDGEVLVKADTIGVSMPEVLVRRGAYAWMPPLPAIPGIELSGTIVARGRNYEGGALVFGAGLAVILGLYFWSNVSRVLLFWAAFILTRPLGATVGDFLDKPVANGGLALSRPLASAAIAAFILVCLFVLPQRAGRHPEASDRTTLGD
jgi:hypothetical protein